MHLKKGSWRRRRASLSIHEVLELKCNMCLAAKYEVCYCGLFIMRMTTFGLANSGKTSKSTGHAENWGAGTKEDTNVIRRQKSGKKEKALEISMNIKVLESGEKMLAY